MSLKFITYHFPLYHQHYHMLIFHIVNWMARLEEQKPSVKGKENHSVNCMRQQITYHWNLGIITLARTY